LGTVGNATGFTSEVVQNNGGIVIELMVDNTNDAMGLVDGWTATYELNCSVVHDKDNESNFQLQDQGANREWAFVIDTSTMEIVWRGFGSLGGSLAIEQYAAVLGLVEICSASYLNCQ
jgi:hypothetical protein